MREAFGRHPSNLYQVSFYCYHSYLWRLVMGATGWMHIVPFQPDIRQALRELQQQIFAEGRYYKVWEHLPGGATPPALSHSTDHASSGL